MILTLPHCHSAGPLKGFVRVQNSRGLSLMNEMLITLYLYQTKSHPRVHMSAFQSLLSTLVSHTHKLQKSLIILNLPSFILQVVSAIKGMY